MSHISAPCLLRKLRKHLRSTDLAHDLRQETFLRVLKVLRSEPELREPERFENFVLGVCNNVLHETYRATEKAGADAPGIRSRQSAASPDACAIAGETVKNVRKLLSRLDPNVRGILQAAFLEEQDGMKSAFVSALPAVICGCCFIAPRRHLAHTRNDKPLR